MARAHDALTGRELAERHVARFNDAVRTGDWEPMLAGFDANATMAFPQVEFTGIDEIRRGYADRPPDDQIVPLGIQEKGEHEVTVAFAWARGGTGRMALTHERGLVTRLAVVFDER